MNELNDKTDHPPSALRTLEILELISLSHNSISIQDIAERLGLPVPSIYRIIGLLLEKKYIEHDTVNKGRYIAGNKILELAHKIHNAKDIFFYAKPIMRAIAEKTGQTCTLAITHEDGVRVIDQAFPSKPVSIIAKAHVKLPVNATANGKVLTTFMKKEEQEVFLKKAWRLVGNFTNKTITNLEQFKQEIHLTKERKYALELEEYSLGIGSIAVPVFDYTQRAVYSLGIVGHIQDYNNRSRVNFILNELIRQGKNLSSKLGYDD